jgi:hypothetical protein
MAAHKHQGGWRSRARCANSWICCAVDNVCGVNKLVDSCNSLIGIKHSAHGNFSALYNGLSNIGMNIIALSTLHAWNVFHHVIGDLIVSRDKFGYTGW